MIKRILVVLDPDGDTPIATEAAIRIAKRHDAELTCLALVDKDAILADSSGSGIGGYAYAERLRNSLTEEVKAKAHELLRTFVAKVDDAGVRHSGDRVSEDGLFTSLVTAMRTNDLMITGRESHFYYHDPEQLSNAIAKVIEHGAAASLIVGQEIPMVKRVSIAYDGSTPAARTLQKFVHLVPYGTEIEVELIHVRGESKEDRLESDKLLHAAKRYLEAYSFESIQTVGLKGGKPAQRILEHASSKSTDLLVTGAYAKRGLKRLVFGSSATRFLEQATVPLFLCR
ncbi:MAG: universal stress protein [Bacteroidota bacterium]